MDAQQLRRVLYDFFKFNPADFIVQASLTGFHIRANKQRQQVAPTFTKDLDGSETVEANRMLDITIDAIGLPDGTPIALDTGGQGGSELAPMFVGSYVKSGLIHTFWHSSSDLAPSSFLAGRLTARALF